MRLSIILVTAMALASCATVNGVPQTPCQRATRAVDAAHAAVDAARAAVNIAVVAGANMIVIAKLTTAVDAADATANTASGLAARVCAAAGG